MGNIPRSFAGSFFLNLEGAKCGFVKAVAGGDVSAEVISEPAGKKHIGGPKYEDFDLRIGLGMTRDVYDWIAESWALKSEPRSGSIVEADAKHDAKTERRFVNALITETSIPALDASSRDPAFLTLKVAPESVRMGKATGKLTAGTKQKQFLPSNFRLELDGLDCSKVSKIDSFTVKEGTAADGGFPNLRITLAESSAKTWNDWFEDFVVNGNNDDRNEKSGAIVFLDPTRKKELGRITLGNVGIFALRRPPRTDDQVARVVAELYCERMELEVETTPPNR